MKKLFYWETKVGTFYICRSSDGYYHVVFNNESYGGYPTPAQAAEDLSLNATFSILHPVTGELLDTSELDIPMDIREWNRY